jgi:hypothetical protein
MENKKTIFEIINEIMKKFEDNFSRIDNIFNDDTNMYIQNDENGQYTTEKGDGYIKEEYESEDGSVKYTSYRYLHPSQMTNLGVSDNDKLSYLQYKLQAALDSENYEDAAKLRDEIKNINS